MGSQLYRRFKAMAIGILLTTGLVAGSFSIGLSTAPAEATPKLSEFNRASIRSLGPVAIGMTVQRAAAASGMRFVQVVSGGEPHCKYYQPQNQPKGVSFMVTNGAIARVDISNPKIKTLSGVKIGDTEDYVKSVYGNKIQVKPHPYNIKGHYLIYAPQDIQDRRYRMIFETDGQRVVRWRFGKIDEVDWIEGCV